jgi:hypothetical protein
MTMKSRILYLPGLALLVTLLALSTVGQAATSDASQSPMATSKAGAPTSAASQSTAASSKSTLEHQATAHHASHAKHKHMAAESPGSTQEAAYRTALKQCVEGPVAHRDGCLDKTIAQFGRS